MSSSDPVRHLRVSGGLRCVSPVYDACSAWWKCSASEAERYKGNVDAGVATLLNKVAPNRAKAGVNPFDTGKFAGIAGPRPEAYRCQIVSARGYALR